MQYDTIESLEHSSRPEAETLQRLTKKQRAVLDLLVQHHTTKEIARKLGIAPNTVDQRLLAAREKLGAKDRKQTARKYSALLEICEEPPCDFLLVDEPTELTEAFIAGLPHETKFELRDSMSFEKSSVFAPETFDARFGKLWRIFAIPILAILVGMVLIWGVAFAKALGEVI